MRACATGPWATHTGLQQHLADGGQMELDADVVGELLL
jgi:hypothetical protein